MGIFGALWRGVKGVGKWAVKHPETVKNFTQAGVSIYDARRRNKSMHAGAHGEYTLANLNERIRQLTDEVATMRTELQQDYTEQIAALSRQVEDIRTAQNYQARALKRIAILFGCLTAILVACVVYLLIR